jgi:hypothetical protein
VDGLHECISKSLSTPVLVPDVRVESLKPFSVELHALPWPTLVTSPSVTILYNHVLLLREDMLNLFMTSTHPVKTKEPI